MPEQAFSVGVRPERIREAVRQSGTTAADVARRIGLTQNALQQWCTGEKTPSTRNLHLLAMATGQRVGFFYGEDDLPEQIRQDADIGRRVRLALGLPQLAPFVRLADEEVVRAQGQAEEMSDEERGMYPLLWAIAGVRPVAVAP